MAAGTVRPSAFVQLSKPYEVFTPKKMQKMVYAASKLSMETLSHQTY
jgi:uncharacterized protein YwgA